MFIKYLLIFPVLFYSCSCNKEYSFTRPDQQPPVPSLHTYYVDGTTGNDQNDGLSLARAWKTIQQSFNAAQPGSTVVIRGGTYYEELVVNVSGKPDHPITFTNYAQEKVMIDGSKIRGNTILSITDRGFLVFKNLVIQNITRNNARGILVLASPNGAAGALPFRNIRFQNINWTNNAQAIPGANDNAQPFIALGRGLTQDNAISNLVIDSCEFSHNITGFSESLSVDGNVDGFFITHNKVHDNTNIGIAAEGHYGTSATASLDQAREGVISEHICYNNVSLYATSGGIYVDGGRDIRVDRNASFQNGYGIEVGNEKDGTTSNISVTNNLIYRNKVSGLAIGGYDPKTTGQVVDCIFRNNSFYQNNTNLDGSGELYITKASRCVIGNNVFYSNNQNLLFSLVDILPQSGISLDYNDWFTVGADAGKTWINWRSRQFNSFKNYRAGTQQEAHSIFADPLFSNVGTPIPDLHLQTMSPCLQQGNPSWIILPAERDYDGKPRVVNGKADMGAYQRQ